MRVLVMLPTYNEIENIEDVLDAPGARCPTPTSSSSTTAVPTAPPTWPRSSARCSATSTCCAARAKSGLGSAYRAGFRVGPRRVATTSWSRWTPTSRTTPRCCPTLRRRGRAGRRPRHRLALRARRLDPRLEVARAALDLRGGSLYARTMLGLSVQRRHRRVPRLPPRRPLAHRPRPRAGRRLRLPGGDDLPHRAQRRPASSRCRSRSATAAWAARRCRAASWSRRCCWSRGGAVRDRVAEQVVYGPRATLRAWPLAEFTVAGALVESSPRASCSSATSGATASPTGARRAA